MILCFDMHAKLYKMNEIVNAFLLAGEKFIPETHLKQPKFTCNACGPFTKNKERIQKFKETGDANYIYKNELDKDLARRTVSDKVLIDKAINISKNPRYDGYQRGLTSMVYKFFHKKSASLPHKSVSGNGVNTHANDKIKQNQHTLDVAAKQDEELHKPAIRNF